MRRALLRLCENQHILSKEPTKLFFVTFRAVQHEKTFKLTRLKAFSHWVTRGRFLRLTSTNSTIGFNFDADVKKRPRVTNVKTA